MVLSMATVSITYLEHLIQTGYQRLVSRPQPVALQLTTRFFVILTVSLAYPSVQVQGTSIVPSVP